MSRRKKSPAVEASVEDPFAEAELGLDPEEREEKPAYGFFLTGGQYDLSIPDEFRRIHEGRHIRGRRL